MSKLPSKLKSTSVKQLKLDKILSSASNSPSTTPTRARSRSPSTKVESPAKKTKIEKTNNDDKNTFAIFKNPTNQITASPLSLSCNLIGELKEKRNKYESISEFRFNKKRVRVLTDSKEISEDSEGIVYWMSREQRVQDNWSLLYAQKLALKQNLPLHVCFCLVPTHLNATFRHYYFMLEGLKEVEKELSDLNIPFHLLIGQAKDQIPIFVKEKNIGAVICDFSPLKVSLNWIEELKKNLPSNVPFAQVDGHNIVPVWSASDKLEYAARTIRNKINSKLDEFLTDFPPVIKQTVETKVKPEKIDWEKCYDSLKCDRNVKIVEWAKPGYEAGIRQLDNFIKNGLKIYDEDRNDPNKNALSNLSPWYHFGQISVQRCILEIKKYGSKYSKSVNGYMEECIVRRELAENFCYYNPNYDNINGAYDWAKQTLKDHSKDKRPFLYTLEDLDNFKTHDKLWNAAQIQMRVEGKMHGFLRMYWAKKILEWTASPEQALEYCIFLNDKYQLDGRESSGYVGCMWSICGIHDQGWAERAIFGKIRYMNYEGCKRKFDVDRFVLKYYGKKEQA